MTMTTIAENPTIKTMVASPTTMENPTITASPAILATLTPTPTLMIVPSNNPTIFHNSVSSTMQQVTQPKPVELNFEMNATCNSSNPDNSLSNKFSNILLLPNLQVIIVLIALATP